MSDSQLKHDSSSVDLGTQEIPKYARQPYVYLLDPARRKRVGDLFSALWHARRHHLADWVRSCFGRRNPFRERMPWLSWPCIDYLEEQVKPGMRVLEYGGGGSTLYFLSKGCQVTTVEGHPDWGSAIRDRAAQFGTAERLNVRIVDTRGEDPSSMESYITAARSGGPWDLILVDGSFRRECLAEAKHCLSATGFLIFDNTHLPDYADAHKLAPEFQRFVFKGLGYGRPAPTETTVFLRPSR
jgi:hypothetical protein